MCQPPYDLVLPLTGGMLLGLSVNVVVPAGTKPGAKLPVAVVSNGVSDSVLRMSL